MSKIANFGSLNIDYVYQVNSFARPGETIQSDNRSIYAGGKGLNQSLALARGGAETIHIGAVGEEGQLLIQKLADSNVCTELVQVLDEPSGHAVIHRDKQGQNMITLFGGANHSFTSERIEEVLNTLDSGDTLLIQNELNVLTEIIETAQRKDLFIVLNPSPVTDELIEAPLEKVDMLILNEIEAEIIAGSFSKKAPLEKLIQKFPDVKLLLTLGDKGALYYEAGLEEPIFQDIFPVVVVDTTAAGDTFTGYFLAQYLAGEAIEKCLEIAAKAAALAVGKAGAAPSIPDLNQVLATSL